MQDRKLRVGVARFPYGGNGGTSSEIPHVGTWLALVHHKVQQDPRMEWVWLPTYSDTPIPMTRNRSVEEARRLGVDVLVMVDSDQVPDSQLNGDKTAKPFFGSSFDFLYQHYERGPVVIAAPYCGPPPHENVYVFQWQNLENDSPNDDQFSLKLEQISRPDAARRSGFEAVDAAATGLIMFDMRIFQHAPPPYFYYEYIGDGEKCEHCGCRKPGRQAEKASTEDVTATRDLALIGKELLGYNPVFVNWDAWAGHMKPKVVMKPRMTTADQVGERLSSAFRRGMRSNEKLVHVQPERYENPSTAPLASGPSDLLTRFPVKSQSSPVVEVIGAAKDDAP